MNKEFEHNTSNLMWMTAMIVSFVILLGFLSLLGNAGFREFIFASNLAKFDIICDFLKANMRNVILAALGIIDIILILVAWNSQYKKIK